MSKLDLYVCSYQINLERLVFIPGQKKKFLKLKIDWISYILVNFTSYLMTLFSDLNLRPTKIK